jgi:CO/xanthine dehydrogenase Mo-binding subunit
MTTTILGSSPLRPDAIEKVTGVARYPGDLTLPGMLHMAVLFAQRPHARIVSLDASHALVYPGVVAVLTAADVPRNEFGLIENDQPVLCHDVVRFVGDKVALVVAESERVARAACALIEVAYEDLSVVADPVAAMEPGAPLVHTTRSDNVLHHVQIRKGDLIAAMPSADVIVDGEFETPWQEHAYLQPEAGLAYIDEAGQLVVETAGQWAHEDRRQIAHALGLAEEQVRVVYATIGGAFGGREDISVQILLALAAWRLRRPVKLVWTREESLIGHIKRHPMRISMRWAATRAGQISAVECRIIADAGAYASTSAEVIKNAIIYAAGCYEVPNISADAYAVYTNNIPSGAFRGFGAPQIQFAAEVMVTRLAAALGMDPVELRARNIYCEGSIQATQTPLPAGVSAPRVLERCAIEAGWRNVGEQGNQNMRGWQRSTQQQMVEKDSDDKRTQHPSSDRDSHSSVVGRRSSLRRGWGLACGIKNIGYSFGFPEQATAIVELHGGASIEQVVIRCAAAEVGQGVHLALRQIAAEALQTPLEIVTLVGDNTDQAPSAGSASASRLTFMAGNAVRGAAAQALQIWNDAEERPAIARYQYLPPTTTPMDASSGACVPNFSYGYCAQAVEVEVDLSTGHARVVRAISVHDVGRIINRRQLEGQIRGCIAQALGYTLTECFVMRDGYVQSTHLSAYLLPTVRDVAPEVQVVLLEEADPHGPFGARGVSEMPFVPFAAAVVAALYDATGVWFSHLPLTPDRVWAGVRGKMKDEA